MLEAAWLQQKARVVNTIDMPRYVVYMSPGWTDYKATIRDLVSEITSKSAIYLFGSVGYQQVSKYCHDLGHDLRHIQVVPSLWALEKVVKPIALLVYAKDLGAVHDYALAAYKVIPRVLIRLKLQKGND